MCRPLHLLVSLSTKFSGLLLLLFLLLLRFSRPLWLSVRSRWRIRTTDSGTLGSLFVWPRSVHQIPDIVAGCTEPFGVHHQSLWCLSTMAYSFCCHACHHTIYQSNRSHTPGLTPYRVVQHHSSFLKRLWLQTAKTSSYFDVLQPEGSQCNYTALK